MTETQYRKQIDLVIINSDIRIKSLQNCNYLSSVIIIGDGHSNGKGNAQNQGNRGKDGQRKGRRQKETRTLD